MGFSRQEYWSGLPFPSPVDHVVSELSTRTRLSWVALHGMAHSVIELDKAVIHVISLLVFCDCGFILSALMEKDKRLLEASWRERLTVGNLGLVLMGGAMLSKCLFQLSVDEQDCVPSLLIGWGGTVGRDHGGSGDLLQKDSGPHCYIQCPWPPSRPLSTHASASDCLLDTHRQVWLSLLCGHSPFLLAPAMHSFVCAPPRVCFPSPVEVLSHWPPKSNSLGVLSPFAGSSGWEICCGSWNFLNNARISAVCGLYAWQLYDGDNGNLL